MYNAVEVFQGFMYPFAIIGILLAAGIIFNNQLTSLEDKLDAWFLKKFNIKMPFGDR